MVLVGGGFVSTRRGMKYANLPPQIVAGVEYREWTAQEGIGHTPGEKSWEKTDRSAVIY